VKLTLLDRIKDAILKRLPKKKQKTVPEPEAPEAPEPSCAPAGEPWLSERQRAILHEITASSTSEVRQVERARILLCYETAGASKAVARTLQLQVKTVRKWCRRWGEARGFLHKLEQLPEPLPAHAYRAAVREVLQDSARTGAPDTFTPEQRTQLVKIACEVLDDQDRPTSHWTQEQLALEAHQRGIVDAISRATVGRILREMELQPHRSRYWLNPPASDPERFAQEVQAICQLYAQAPALQQEGVHLLSVDEKSGIQAVERAHPTQAAAPAPGKGHERREFEYLRCPGP